MSSLSIFTFVLWGIFPSLAWLAFYLRKDVHPEPNSWVLKVFLWGMLVAAAAAVVELGITKLGFVGGGAALVEETLKFWIIRAVILKNPEVDEPVDVMLYMLIGALGFAAVENVAVFLDLNELSKLYVVGPLRFFGATVLHALCGATLGFFLAQSFFHSRERSLWLVVGLTIVVGYHWLFNYSLEILGNNPDYLVLLIMPVVVISVLVLFCSWGFKKVKKMQSVCLIPQN